jgi:uncharacterized cupredoxin-like copper-binding protein/cytochrome c2
MIILVFGSLAVLGACGSPDETAKPTVTRIPNPPNAPVVGSPTTTAAAASPAASPATAQTGQPSGPVEVDMVDVNFAPKEITIPANTDVTINLANKGAAVHNFNIDALNVHSGDVAPGASGSVTVNAAPGDYQYYCAVPGHKEAGMVGTLHVVAGGAPAATAAPSVAAATPSAATAVPPTGPVEVDMVDVSFAPKEITIPANQDVTVNLANKGAAVHNFNVDQLNVHSGDYQPGQTGTVTINAAPGDYQYYCAIPGHKEAGMVGTLHVVAGGAPATTAVPTAAAASPAATPAASPGAEAAGPQTGPVDVTLADFRIDPKEITIAANTPVTINLVNNGATAHNFNIDALNVHSGDVAPGGSGSVTINAPAGVYQYYCNIPGHKQAGMVGVLKVVVGGAPAAATPVATAAATPIASPAATAVASPGASPAVSVVLPAGDVERGKAAAAVCLGCHSVNGSPSVGPTWKDLYGSQVQLESGKTVTADDAYLYQSITDPNAETVKGFPAGAMPKFPLNDQQIADLIAYIESLKE